MYNDYVFPYDMCKIAHIYIILYIYSDCVYKCVVCVEYFVGVFYLYG